jgi:hypothetical protein
MSNNIDESRLKEIIKTAIVEVLEERRDLVREANAGAKQAPEHLLTLTSAGTNAPTVGPTAKTIIFWVALLMTALLLYQLMVFRTTP